MKPSRKPLFRAAATVTAALHALSTLPTPVRAAQAQEAPVLVEQPEQPPPVEARRALPRFNGPTAVPSLSAEPTDEEFFRARLFDEPLIPIGGAPTPGENRALRKALQTWAGSERREDLSAIQAFLAAWPQSRWRVALLTNLGIIYRNTGYFLRALRAWEEAWALGRAETEPIASAIVDRALGQLADLNARLGRIDRLESLFAEIEGRNVRGSATELVSGARQGLWLMKNRPQEAFLCGPMALDRILAFGRSAYQPDSRVLEFPSTQSGTSLSQIHELAKLVGLGLQMAKRDGDAEIDVPAVVHWKAGHFAALVERQGDHYRVQDPTFGRDMWVSRRALLEETTGYFLQSEAPLPVGWRAVSTEEGDHVWGKGSTASSDPGYQTPDDDKDPNCCEGSCEGLAGHAVHSMLVSLNITDTPVGYAPPRGPAVRFTATYNQRDAFQPQVFSYANLGPKWTFDWISYVEDDPSGPLSQAVTVYRRRGGQEQFFVYDAGTASYTPAMRSRAVLARTSAGLNPVTYERRLADGSVEVFSVALPGTPRKVLMTQARDPQGNAVTFSYDASLRLVAVTDAIGQVTTISYDLPFPDDLKITRVTDPFGRYASFEYNAAGQLKKITDVAGLTSEFQYGSGDFIESLTTPYGVTSFVMGESGRDRWIEITDPLGAKERVEYKDVQAPGIPPAEPVVPAGMIATNSYLNYRNTFYWSKRAMALYPGDYSKAKITHWPKDGTKAAGVKASEKKPIENRVWYNYPGQTTNSSYLGSAAQPTKVGRVLDDGSTQLYQYEYNAKGRKTREVDPVGRTKPYVCDANDIDLKEIRRVNGQESELLQSFTYNSQHLPLTVTDAAGQTTTYTYAAQGQVATVVTPPRDGLTLAQRTTTYSYDPNGYLQGVTGPLAGATTSYTYDGYGRVRTTTDSDGYTLTYDYDALDRTTRVTYPDGTFEQTVYNRLDAEQRRDRFGRWSRTLFDVLRRPTAVRDATGRTVTQVWCNCGSLDKLIDPKGNPTTWERDIEGRVTREVRANGSAKEFTYETTTIRLKQVKDAKNQVTSYSYFLDDKLEEISYTSAQVATPNVSFTYDPVEGRLATMADGTGTTSYAYHPVAAPPTLGADQLASVDGPLANDTISYTNDELGRVRMRTLNGVTTTWAYDALGRLTTHGDPIGNFTYGYVGTTGRVSSVTYPNGQTTTYAYLPVNQERRLQEIHHKKPGGATLNKFNYTYDVVGNITMWTQQIDANPAKAYDLGYDSADQLVSAVYRSTDPTPTIVKRYGWAYDSAGNRTTEQIDDAAMRSSYDNMNRLTSQQPGGALTFKGTTNEPAVVTVAGTPATTTVSNQFTGTAQLPGGTSTVQVQATDPSGNLRTTTYQVSQTGPSKTLTYDPNGNLASDGTNSYEWDAENRLVAVKQGATTLASFTYDGRGRRASKTADGVTITYVYDWIQFVEERFSTGSTKRYLHGLGFDRPVAQVVGGSTSYNVADHLGSLVRTTDSLGSPTLTREYDPWGNLLQESTSSGHAFTGREWDSDAGLYYYRARYYDPRIARFLSEDPLAVQDRTGTELNNYAYVANNPIKAIDPTGAALCVVFKQKDVPFPKPVPGSDLRACPMAGPCLFCPVRVVRVNVWVPPGIGCPDKCFIFFDPSKPEAQRSVWEMITVCVWD